MNKLKEKLKNKQITFGTWIQIPHPSIIEIIANSCDNKLDWICIDMEHGIIDIESMANLIRTIEKEGLVPVVRIPKNDYIWIHRVLDAGAKGLIIPMIKNKEEIDFACNECLYPPLGKRSFGFSRSNSYGINFDYCKDYDNDSISIIPQIEHVDAINNLEAIFENSFIDGSFIGPLDLKGSIKRGEDQFDLYEYENLLKKYIELSNKKNIPSGLHIIHPDEKNVKEAINNGYKIIALGLDIVFLRDGCKKVFE